MFDSLTILVSGATGQQGGSVADALLDRGHRVRALTRDPDSPEAQRLAERHGVHTVRGNFHDHDSLTEALAGADAAFLMGTPFEAGTDDEAAQGIAFADAAKASGLPYLLYSSVSDADRGTGIPHFDSKFRVEEYIRNLGIPHTIIAPAFFYDNMLGPFVLPGLRNGTLAQALPVGVKLQSISAKNIGSVVAEIFERRSDFLGRRINIAGDELSGPEYAAAISKASGRSISYFEVPIEQVRHNSEDMALMYEWFRRVGYTAEVEGLKREFPTVRWETFQDWADRQNWSVLNAERTVAG